MLTQLPRFINKHQPSDKPAGPANSFSDSVKQAYINNRADYNTFKTVAKLSNDEEHRKKPITLEQRLRNSQHILRQAYLHMHNTMVSISHGEAIPMDTLYTLVRKILKHLERHSDSILYLSRNKQKAEYTYMRSVSFCILLLDFTRALGFSEKDLLHIGVGALLHDAGKMWVPQHILNKSGKLSQQEFRKIRAHIKFSELILYNNHITNPLSQQVSLQHHERNDGSGYPYGLKQGEISAVGQIAAIVDVYDAITSNRCYKQQLEPAQALKYLLKNSGDQFNGEMVQRFVQHLGVYPIGSTVKLNNNIIGIVIEKGRDLLKPIIKVVYDETTHRLIPPSRISLGDINDLYITQTLSAAQLRFNPLRFIS